MTKEFALIFASNWIADWNAHDLEKILEHYCDDFTIESPMALQLMPESQGCVSGKTSIKAYWRKGLERNPQLKFELIDVLVGINRLTVYYSNIATKEDQLK